MLKSLKNNGLIVLAQSDKQIIEAIPIQIPELKPGVGYARVHHKKTTDDIDNFNKQIQKVSENIQKRKYEPCKGRHCDWCDYKELICPEWG